MNGGELREGVPCGAFEEGGAGGDTEIKVQFCFPAKCKTAFPSSDESRVFSLLGLAVPNDECEVPHYPALNPKGNER